MDPYSSKIRRSVCEHDSKAMTGCCIILFRALGSPTTALSYPNGKPRSSIDVLIAAHVLLPNPLRFNWRYSLKFLRKDVHDLYFKLLPDYTFKKVFLSTLMNYYPQAFKLYSNVNHTSF